MFLFFAQKHDILSKYDYLMEGERKMHEHDGEPPKKKKFKLFDSQREGKGVTKEQANLPPNLKKFFFLYKRDFTRLWGVNALLVFGNFPVFFLILAFIGFFSIDYTTPASNVFPLFSGISSFAEISSPLLALDGIWGVQTSGSVFLPTAYIFIALGLLVFFTFGIVNVGTTYILRNMIKGDPVFIWSDFWYAIRRNFKQAFFYGILDLIIVCLLPWNLLQLSAQDNFWLGIVFWCNILVAILYFTMRRYIYLQMVTFDLSIYKILKNALIFSILGFKRNFMAFLGILLLCFITVACAYSGILLALAVALPLFLLFSNASYMTTYAAYYVIKKYMIDPYQKNHPEEDTPAAEPPVADDMPL